MRTGHINPKGPTYACCPCVDSVGRQCCCLENDTVNRVLPAHGPELSEGLVSWVFSSMQSMHSLCFAALQCAAGLLASRKRGP